MKQVFYVCAALAIGLCAFGAQRMTEAELDALVDKLVQYEHPDFVQGCIDELKAAGRLAEPDLAEAFYRGIDRFKARTAYGRSGRLCLDWFNRTASDAQIGRLREAALSGSGDFGRQAVWVYFDRMVGKPESLSFLDDVLRKNPSLHGAVWGALFPHVGTHGTRRLDAEFIGRLLNFVDKWSEEPLNAWPCDDILCQGIEGYAKSQKRKDRLGRILQSATLEKLPRARDHFLKELKNLEGRVK